MGVLVEGTWVTKTSLDIDHELVRRAKTVLGTRTLKETVDASLREVVDARRRLELLDLLRQPDRFDATSAEAAWGGEET